jgi:Short-chain alcohol dehydrogenase of unknown specificity
MSTQTWFITGASSGLGASVANAALRAGHRVAVTARDRVRLEKLTEADPDAVLPLSMDLTKPSEIKARSPPREMAWRYRCAREQRRAWLSRSH